MNMSAVQLFPALADSSFAIRHSSFPLAVGFITPAFAIAGVLLVAIPIAIHLLNRRRFKTIDWAAMQFLLAAMRKNRRRVQFEQWILLATRCALIALAGLALARPLGCDGSKLASLVGAGSAAVHVIVIDNSYPMAYEAGRADAPTQLDQARKLAGEIVSRLQSGGDSVVLITAGAPARFVIAKPSYDLQAVVDAINRVPQAYTGADLSGALTLAQQVAVEEVNQPSRVLHIITDASTSAWRGNDAASIEAIGPQLASRYRVRTYNLSTPDQSNNAVLDVAPVAGLVRTRFANDFRATARAYGATVESSLVWKIGDETLPQTSSSTLTTQSLPVTQSNVQLRTGGPAVMSVSLAAQDKLPIDNTRYRTVDVAAEMKVLLVEGRRGTSPLDGSAAFLELALAPPASSGATPGVRTTTSYIKPERISDIELSSRVLGDYRAIMISDVAQISAPVAEQLEKYVRQGGTVVWFMGEQVQRESYNTTLVPRGLLPGPLTQRQTSTGYTFAFNPSGNNHPLLGAFANSENSGLSTAQVFTYWQISPKEDLKIERVLSFSGTQSPGDVAVSVQALGDGRVVFFASTADAEWTNLPAKPAYVALIHEIVAGTVAGTERWMNRTVGQRIDIPSGVILNGAPVVRAQQSGANTPADIPLEQITRADGTRVWSSAPIDKPGVYNVISGERSIPVSVNLPTDSADVRPLNNDAVRAALGNIDIEATGAELPAVADASPQGNDFGWSVMTIVLILLGVECFLAMRFSHERVA